MPTLLTGDELASKTVKQIFPPIKDSIFGDFNGVIQTLQQAKNILEIVQITRDVGCRLNETDKLIEEQAYIIVNRSKK